MGGSSAPSLDGTKVRACTGAQTEASRAERTIYLKRRLTQNALQICVRRSKTAATEAALGGDADEEFAAFELDAV
jgi:hypothetical protein